MCKIRESGKVRARERIAVLAALNLAFDLTDQGAVTTPVPERAGSGLNSAADTPAQDSDVLLTSLLQRLDLALGDDGRLL